MQNVRILLRGFARILIRKFYFYVDRSQRFYLLAFAICYSDIEQPDVLRASLFDTKSLFRS